MRSPGVVSVSDLLGGRHASRAVSAKTPVSLHLEQVEVDGDADVDLLLEGTEGRVSARGQLEVELKATCVRCLTASVERITVPFGVLFARQPGDDEYPVADDDTIDLSQAARDELAASVPLLPLCQKDCAGLCPVCGTDLNTSRCPGHEVEDDSPFAVLRPLVSD